jgi:hypothetical protein
MRAAWPHAAVALAGAILALVWPLSSALSSRDVLQARLAAAVLTVVVCTAIALSKGVHPWWVWTAASMAAAAAGLAVLLSHVAASSTCVASYDNHLVVIGREYTAAAAGYARANPSARDLLLDAGGAADKVWTPASIASCGFWIGWAGPLVAPLFAACVSALVARRTPRFASVPARTPAGSIPVAGRAARYDAFLSYRHVDPDSGWAKNIAEVLESHNLRVAIDFRDFEANEHFLSEMERCIKESRFVLCVVTSRYIDSDHCSEEAIISKTLDLADRRKRLVPLVFERVELPIWLHGLVGIDFTPSGGIDPIERLLALMRH